MPAEPATTRRALAEGSRHFDAGRYFEAHEVWEDAWRVEEGEARRLLVWPPWGYPGYPTDRSGRR